ncbi:MAG: gamma-glutamylcyclotransferase family protein [Pseudomonadota bacterium]
MNAEKADCRLAVYGSLAPGRVNHRQLDGVTGEWRTGQVRGKLFATGWGSTLGYPGLILDPDGPVVEVEVLTSPDLPDHWERLDRFEGAGYRRVITPVLIDGVEIEANIYTVVV